MSLVRKVSKVGTITYTVNNIRHNDNGPAVILKDGHEYFYLNGVEMSRAEYHYETSRVPVLEQFKKKRWV